jgi:uncharacterized protein (DUF433 family)
MQNPLRRGKKEKMIMSDPEIMQGTPVYRGTRIPVELVADMLEQGVTVEEIVAGYPALDSQKVALALPFMLTFPRRDPLVYRPMSISSCHNISIVSDPPAGASAD